MARKSGPDFVFIFAILLTGLIAAAWYFGWMGPIADWFKSFANNPLG